MPSGVSLEGEKCLRLAKANSAHPNSLQASHFSLWYPTVVTRLPVKMQRVTPSTTSPTPPGQGSWFAELAKEPLANLHQLVTAKWAVS